MALESHPHAQLMLLNPELTHALIALVLEGSHWGMIILPGGHIESDEDPKQAVTRELLEETGIQIEESALTLLIETDVCTQSGIYHTHGYFAVTQPPQKPRYTDTNKSPWQWYKIDELTTLFQYGLLLPTTQTILTAYLNHIYATQLPTT